MARSLSAENHHRQRRAECCGHEELCAMVAPTCVCILQLGAGLHSSVDRLTNHITVSQHAMAGTACSITHADCQANTIIDAIILCWVHRSVSTSTETRITRWWHTRMVRAIRQRSSHWQVTRRWTFITRRPICQSHSLRSIHTLWPECCQVLASCCNHGVCSSAPNRHSPTMYTPSQRPTKMCWTQARMATSIC
jgi:hypothetical protein